MLTKDAWEYLELPDNPPNGPRGIGSGAIERLTSRPLDSFSDSGGLFLADLSSSKTSSTGGCNKEIDELKD